MHVCLNRRRFNCYHPDFLYSLSWIIPSHFAVVHFTIVVVHNAKCYFEFARFARLHSTENPLSSRFLLSFSASQVLTFRDFLRHFALKIYSPDPSNYGSFIALFVVESCHPDFLLARKFSRFVIFYGYRLENLLT